MRASDADEYVYVVRNIVINEAVVHTREGSSQKSWDGQKSLKNVFYQEAASKLQRSHTSTHSMVTLKSIRRVSVCEANNTIVAWEKIVGTVRITTLYLPSIVSSVHCMLLRIINRIWITSGGPPWGEISILFFNTRWSRSHHSSFIYACLVVDSCTHASLLLPAHQQLGTASPCHADWPWVVRIMLI